MKDARWRWLAPSLGEDRVDWRFFHAIPGNALERWVRRPDLALIHACYSSIRSISREGADLLVTHGPRAAYWCEFMAKRMRARAPHVVYSFNYDTLPTGLKRKLVSDAFQHVDQFVVYSTIEKQLYADYFGIPPERIDVKLWGVAPPQVADPSVPMEPGDYLCAIGGNRRDYKTLMAAVSRLPHVRLVAVVRPASLNGVEVPPNVSVRINLPFPKAMNILKHSRFMVLPLDASDVPCGHVTLVAAMYLGKGFLITNSTGVKDYVLDGVNAITCEARSPQALADAIALLWSHPDRCQQLGANGKDFAAQHCSEESMRDHLETMLCRRGLLAART